MSASAAFSNRGASGSICRIIRPRVWRRFRVGRDDGGRERGRRRAPAHQTRATAGRLLRSAPPCASRSSAWQTFDEMRGASSRPASSTHEGCGTSTGQGFGTGRCREVRLQRPIGASHQRRSRRSSSTARRPYPFQFLRSLETVLDGSLAHLPWLQRCQTRSAACGPRVEIIHQARSSASQRPIREVTPETVS